MKYEAVMVNLMMLVILIFVLITDTLVRGGLTISVNE
jgi:hypothetical protein